MGRGRPRPERRGILHRGESQNGGRKTACPRVDDSDFGEEEGGRERALYNRPCGMPGRRSSGRPELRSLDGVSGETDL